MIGQRQQQARGGEQSQRPAAGQLFLRRRRLTVRGAGQHHGVPVRRAGPGARAGAELGERLAGAGDRSVISNAFGSNMAKDGGGN